MSPTQPSQFNFDCFISHNSADKPFARTLAKRLDDAGLRVWFDEWAIEPGDDIFLKIEHGLQTSRILILCLSSAALSSDWVILERNTVLFRDPANTQRRFVPILLDKCDLPDTLRRYSYIDFTADPDAAFRKLYSACGKSQEIAAHPLLPATVAAKNTDAFSGDQTELHPETKLVPAYGPLLVDIDEPYLAFQASLLGHTAGLVHCKAYKESGLLLSTDKEYSIRLWALGSLEHQATFAYATRGVNAPCITSDGRYLLSSSFDNVVAVWDVRRGIQVASLVGHTSRVVVICSLPDTAVAVSFSADSTIRVWDLDKMECIRSLKHTPDPINAGSISKDGSLAVTGHESGAVAVWNLTDASFLFSFNGHSAPPTGVAFAPDCEMVLSCSSDMTVKVWSLDTRSCVGTLEGHTGPVVAMALAPNGRLLATVGSTDHTLRLWDWKTGECLQVLLLDEGGLATALCFDPDATRLFVGASSPSRLQVYSVVREYRPSLGRTHLSKHVIAKVVLVGEGAVGKTSLAHRLIADRYVVSDRTHGMNVWRLPFPNADQQVSETKVRADDENIEKEALLWDLAGQEDYRLIHRLFLDDTALAIVVVNPQAIDPFGDAEDWIKSLDAATRDRARHGLTARILVFSQIDVGGLKVSNAKVERFYKRHEFAGWVPTSARSGEGCSDSASPSGTSELKKMIADIIPWKQLPWTRTPEMLNCLKEAVMEVRERYGVSLLRFVELFQRVQYALPNLEFDERSVRTALKLLGNHGIVKSLMFGDLVLLRPDLLNGYASAIIRAARAHVDEIGCVREEAIFSDGFDFTGVQRLDRTDEELLLRALVQTLLQKSMCIAEDTAEGRQLVFPSQYRRDRPVLDEPNAFVSYSFSGEWQTVWTTLLVRLWYSQQFSKKELWRNAAELETRGCSKVGLSIRHDRGTGRASVSIFFEEGVSDDLKILLVEYVFQHLQKHCVHIERDLHYVCPSCRRPVTDLEAVRERLSTSKEFIFCQFCDEKVPLVEFLEQAQDTNAVAKKILEMELTATQSLERQSLEQLLVGHMMAICLEADQVFVHLRGPACGIDGVVHFKRDVGSVSEKRIYLHLACRDVVRIVGASSDRLDLLVVDDCFIGELDEQDSDIFVVTRITNDESGEDLIVWGNAGETLRQTLAEYEPRVLAAEQACAVAKADLDSHKKRTKEEHEAARKRYMDTTQGLHAVRQELYRAKHQISLEIEQVNLRALWGQRDRAFDEGGKSA